MNGDDEQQDHHDQVRQERTPVGEGVTGLGLQRAQERHREEEAAGAEQDRAADAEPDVPTEALDRVDRLLLRVRDDQVLQLPDRLLRIVGHALLLVLPRGQGLPARRRSLPRRGAGRNTFS